LTVPKYRIVRKIYSVKEATELNLLACVVCGEYVVGELPPDLQRARDAIADATPEKPVSDLELLDT
ncbi:MAG TPA: hypothetical protein VNI84_15095, partial [Pyrinomonadaceae bacterium]|nr:hypothetical protein [Pyrinomonadaceae bacterium]